VITLGLQNFRGQQDFDLSVDVSQALVDTLAWCTRDEPQSIQNLRSSALEPSAVLLMSPWRQEEDIKHWLELKLASYSTAVNTLRQRRADYVKSVRPERLDVAKAQALGRLLLYNPLETVNDEAAVPVSRGFFDGEDAPPWDTWFWYSNKTVFSWVPNSRVADAHAGISANPVDCIRWADWLDLPGLLNR
jgi:hypothetical protein